MKRARHGLLLLALALAGCTAAPFKLAPPVETVALRFLSTTASTPLLNDLITAYPAAPETMLFFRHEEYNYAGLVSAIEQAADVSIYGLTTYLPADSPLWAAPIGQDDIAVVAHPDNPVTNLSLAQLQAVYQGRIDNWQALGGVDSPIQVISREAGSGTRALFEAFVVGNSPLSLNAQVVFSSTAMRERVGENPAAIGYLSAGLVDARIKALTLEGYAPGNLSPTYPLRSPIFVVGLEEPQGFDRVFIAWMQSPAGQSVVARHHRPLGD